MKLRLRCLQMLWLTVSAAVAAAAGAQAYPDRPLRIVVPSPPGGGIDLMGRILAQRLTENLGKSVIVENRGGAGGNIGTELVARASRDGYTLLIAGSQLVANPSLYSKISFDPVKDFDPIGLAALAPNILVVHPSLAAKSVREFIALAKKEPGQIGFAGAGPGSTPHLAGELFNIVAGVSMVHVPYRGTGPATIGLLAGEVGSMFMVATAAMPYIKAGRLRALGVTTATRLPSMTDLPTIAESGLPGYESMQWYGLLAPAATPEKVLSLLNAQVAGIIRNPEMQQWLVNNGAIPVGGTRQQFASHIKSEIVKWAAVIKTSGARAD